MPQTVETKSLLTVRGYHDLAVDPAKRTYLCKEDSMIQFLVYVLDSKCDEIVATSLQTLVLLSEKLELRPILGKVFGLRQSLQPLLQRTDNHEILRHARKIYNRLFIDARESFQPFKDIYNTSSDCKVGTNSVNGHRAKTKVLVYKINGLYDVKHRKQSERELIKLKGLISVTFSSNRCIVRAKQDFKPELIAKAIASTNCMTAQQIVKNKDGKEVFVSFGTDTTEDPAANKENTELPSYLSDEENSPIKSNAVAKNSTTGNVSSWLSTATNFLSRSFYW
ncbi:ARMC1 (predicted) [Pycnogonum litorale]